MVREIISHGVARKILAGGPLAVEEDVFGFKRAGQIGFGDNAGRHVPVKRAAGGGIAVRLADAVAVAVIGVGVTGGAGEAVFRIKVVIQPDRRCRSYRDRAIGRERNQSESAIKTPPATKRCVCPSRAAFIGSRLWISCKTNGEAELNQPYHPKSAIHRKTRLQNIKGLILVNPITRASKEHSDRSTGMRSGDALPKAAGEQPSLIIFPKNITTTRP